MLRLEQKLVEVAGLAQRLRADGAHVFALHSAQPLIHARQGLDRDFNRLLAEFVVVVEPCREPHGLFPVALARDVGALDPANFQPETIGAEIDCGQLHLSARPAARRALSAPSGGSERSERGANSR